MATNDKGDLLDGIWIIPYLGEGSACYINEAEWLLKNKEANDGENCNGNYYIPSSLILRLVQGYMKIQYQHPEIQDVIDIENIREWIKNYPAVSFSDHLANELRKLAIKCGMLLVWRGEITTSLADAESVGEQLRLVESQIKQLEWPYESLIHINYVSKKFYEATEIVTLGKLMGQIEEVVASEDKEVTDTVGSKSDPVNDLRLIKSLLDEGLITQEEFAEKRTEILTRI